MIVYLLQTTVLPVLLVSTKQYKMQHDSESYSKFKFDSIVHVQVEFVTCVEY